jgi:hypothetical protein
VKDLPAVVASDRHAANVLPAIREIATAAQLGYTPAEHTDQTLFLPH